MSYGGNKLNKVCGDNTTQIPIAIISPAPIAIARFATTNFLIVTKSVGEIHLPVPN